MKIHHDFLLMCRRRWHTKLALPLLLAVFICMPLFSGLAAWAGKAEHVVIMVWDGLRPDCVGPRSTPVLYQLAREGVFFSNHHPVFISSTEVNGAALITGAHPEHSGIGANRDYRPEIGWLEPCATEALDTVRRGDWLTGGHYIPVPTVTETVQAAGFRTVVAGTKSVALLLGRAVDHSSPAASQSVNFYKGHTVPPSALAALVKDCGGKTFPSSIWHPNSKQDAWTTMALTHSLWKTEVPKLSILWMSDPDYSQHNSGPGSRTARRALRSVDLNLASVLAALDEKKVRDKTDLFVVSDHGFSTVQRGVDVVALLKKAKFQAVRKFADPEPGQILVVGLGGAVALYVVGHAPAVVEKLVEFFQNTDFSGVIFTRVAMEGTFPLDQVRLNVTNAPDVLVSLHWSRDPNLYGLPGRLISDGGQRGKGSHGSLSPFDMRNTLVAAGPDFQSGWVDELPSGNTDLAPTVLAILGIPPIRPLDGRVLVEALRDPGVTVPKAEPQITEASRVHRLFRWSQYLKFSTVDNAIYFDEGNGEPVRR
jgi:predicted AlkP superfamily pyrophosphatase or phosphodiesterase